MFTMIPYRPAMTARPQYPLDDFFRPFFGRPEDRSFRVDVKDNGDSYLLEAELPGLSKEDLHVDLENDVLTISVCRDDCREEKNDAGYVIRERRMGRASRALNVEGIRKDDITAAYQDGMLRLTLPKEQPDAVPARRTVAIA